jgi:signal transduction histidine kinase
VGRARSTLALALLVGAASAVVVLGSNAGATTRPALHGAVESVIAVVAALAALLAGVRANSTRRLDDFVLAAALSLLAASHIAFSMLPSAFSATSPAWAWASSTGRLAGAILLAVAALVPQAPVERARGLVTGLSIGGAVTLVLIGALFALNAAGLPGSRTPAGELQGRVAVYAVHVATLLAFVVAAAGFVRRWLRVRERLEEWLATAAALAAISRFDFLLDANQGLSSVRAGDVLRVLFYMLIVVGLVRDAAGRTADAAVHRERRRIARDLHDGLAQELAFIVRRVRALDHEGELVAAAERALAESRLAIAALRRSPTEPLDVTLGAALDGLAARVGTRLVLDLAPVSGVTDDQREALVAIAHEAVANAARHADADVVRVELEQERDVRLVVRDDGVGFDPAGVGRGRFGIAGMRERADAIGASLRVSSRPGEGTEVEVVL